MQRLGNRSSYERCKNVLSFEHFQVIIVHYTLGRICISFHNHKDNKPIWNQGRKSRNFYQRRKNADDSIHQFNERKPEPSKPRKDGTILCGRYNK